MRKNIIFAFIINTLPYLSSNYSCEMVALIGMLMKDANNRKEAYGEV